MPSNLIILFLFIIFTVTDIFDLFCGDFKGIYIMTLGVVLECRKLGIASKLLE